MRPAAEEAATALHRKLAVSLFFGKHFALC
jgi:hypothetical protein